MPLNQNYYSKGPCCSRMDLANGESQRRETHPLKCCIAEAKPKRMLDSSSWFLLLLNARNSKALGTICIMMSLPATVSWMAEELDLRLLWHLCKNAARRCSPTDCAVISAELNRIAPRAWFKSLSKLAFMSKMSHGRIMSHPHVTVSSYTAQRSPKTCRFGFSAPHSSCLMRGSSLGAAQHNSAEQQCLGATAKVFFAL